MTDGVVVRDSRIDGEGVFALRNFHAGDLVLTLDDSRGVPDRSKLTPEQSKYEIDVFVDRECNERVIFAGTPERDINHSCDPNLYIRTDMKSGVRKAYALKEIIRGQELNWDYMVNGWEAWEIPMECKCGSLNCRRLITGNFFTLSKAVQRRWLGLLDEPFKKKFKNQLDLIV